MLKFEHPAADTLYHPEEQIVETRWKNPANAPDTHQIISAAGRAVKEHKAPVWLWDQRQIADIPHESRQWLTLKFLPKMLKEPFLEQIAFLVSKSYLEQRRNEGLEDQTAMGNILIGYFTEPAELYRWITPTEEIFA